MTPGLSATSSLSGASGKATHREKANQSRSQRLGEITWISVVESASAVETIYDAFFHNVNMDIS